MNNHDPTLAQFAEQLSHASDDRRMVAISSAVACLVLIWLIVPLRFVARWCSAMHYGWDDWMIGIALFLSTAFVIDTALSFGFGGGQHTVLLLADFDKMVAYIKNSLANEVLFMPTLMAIKVSILLLYGRLFPTKVFRRVLWGVGIFIGAYTIASTVVCLVQCIPLNRLWQFYTPGKCLNIVTALTIFGSLNVVTTFVILALPIPLIWQLHTTKTIKLQITGMFLTGAFVSVISIVRTYYISRIDLMDPTWTQTDPVAWTAAEVAVAIICACLPTYRPLFDKSVRRSARTSSGNSDRSWLKSKDMTDSPVDLEASLTKIHVQTTIENSWDEQYRVSQCPTAEDIWSDQRCHISRSNSRRKLTPSPGASLGALGRSLSTRKLTEKSSI